MSEHFHPAFEAPAPPEPMRLALRADQGRSGAAFSLSRYLDTVERAETIPLQGRVLRVVGLLIESQGPRARVGEVCDIISDSGPALPVQVVGFRDGVLLTVPLGEVSGIRPGDRIIARKGAIAVDVGPQLLGRVVDALGRPLDDRPLRTTDRVPLHPPPMNPMQRDSVATPLETGVRAIDGFSRSAAVSVSASSAGPASARARSSA